MIWIILALTLGATITSIIHGVFMLFGSLTISGSALPGIPSTMLAILPIISAIFALIGGIIAFNQSKWGALFLFLAMGLSVPSRDTWLYGGLYFIAGLCCFFLKGNSDDGYAETYEDYDVDDGDQAATYGYDNVEQEFYYEPSEQMQIPEPDLRPADGDMLTAQAAPQPNNEPPRLRRRMSKSCPECGAVVSRDAFYCPTCGAKLFVVPDEHNDERARGPVLEHAPLDTGDNMVSVNEQLFAPADEPYAAPLTYNGNEEGVMPVGAENQAMESMDVEEGVTAVNHRKIVSRANEAAVSYAEFSRYANRGKKRRKSFGRKILSMLLLVGAVGGALYFLLGLRKLPPGELPPIARPEVVPSTRTGGEPVKAVSRQEQPPTIAEPEVVAIADNTLPNFAPERTPRNGAIIGSNVNVRADHTTSSSRVTRLNVGTRVEVLDTFNVQGGQHSGIWYNIRTGGKEGWVYGRYLQPLGSGLPTGYSAALLKTFGSNKGQLIESLGQPSRSTSSSVEWSGLTATLKGDEITRLRLNNASRELQNGLKVGMSQTALLQVMGYPSSVNGQTLNYNENGKTGISVQLDRNSAISTITINELK